MAGNRDIDKNLKKLWRMFDEYLDKVTVVLIPGWGFHSIWGNFRGNIKGKKILEKLGCGNCY